MRTPTQRKSTKMFQVEHQTQQLILCQVHFVNACHATQISMATRRDSCWQLEMLGHDGGVSAACHVTSFPAPEIAG